MLIVIAGQVRARRYRGIPCHACGDYTLLLHKKARSGMGRAGCVLGHCL